MHYRPCITQTSSSSSSSSSPPSWYSHLQLCNALYHSGLIIFNIVSLMNHHLQHCITQASRWKVHLWSWQWFWPKSRHKRGLLCFLICQIFFGKTKIKFCESKKRKHHQLRYLTQVLLEVEHPPEVRSELEVVRISYRSMETIEAKNQYLCKVVWTYALFR